MSFSCFILSISTNIFVRFITHFLFKSKIPNLMTKFIYVGKLLVLVALSIIQILFLEEIFVSFHSQSDTLMFLGF